MLPEGMGSDYLTGTEELPAPTEAQIEAFREDSKPNEEWDTRTTPVLAVEGSRVKIQMGDVEGSIVLPGDAQVAPGDKLRVIGMNDPLTEPRGVTVLPRDGEPIELFYRTKQEQAVKDAREHLDYLKAQPVNANQEVIRGCLIKEAEEQLKEAEATLARAVNQFERLQSEKTE